MSNTDQGSQKQGALARADKLKKQHSQVDESGAVVDDAEEDAKTNPSDRRNNPEQRKDHGQQK
jgi:hypothetical protein